MSLMAGVSHLFFVHLQSCDDFLELIRVVSVCVVVQLTSFIEV